MNDRPRLLLAACTLAAGLAGSAGAQTTFRQDFASWPTDWEVQGKPLTPQAVFEVVADPADPARRVLNMHADAASASLKTRRALDGVDLNRTPILRWRWRVSQFPTGADGRDPARDDQAIGLYLSTGNVFNQQSLAYRWETETPAGAEGRARYAKVVSVQWFCVRNQQDGTNTYFIEERNVAEDFKKAYGTVPKAIGFSISCNSQYTRSRAEAQLDWFEFVPLPSAGR